jgi:hypothetical protein
VFHWLHKDGGITPENGIQQQWLEFKEVKEIALSYYRVTIACSGGNPYVSSLEKVHPVYRGGYETKKRRFVMPANSSADPAGMLRILRKDAEYFQPGGNRGRYLNVWDETNISYDEINRLHFRHSTVALASFRDIPEGFSPFAAYSLQQIPLGGQAISITMAVFGFLDSLMESQYYKFVASEEIVACCNKNDEVVILERTTSEKSSNTEIQGKSRIKEK